MGQHRRAIYRWQRGRGLCVSGGWRERDRGNESKNQSAHAREKTSEEILPSGRGVSSTWMPAALNTRALRRDAGGAG